MYLYQKTRRYFAQVTGGFEELAQSEIKELGGFGTEIGHRGIYFNAEKQNLYNINYQSRIISRVLAPLIQFRSHDDKQLYGKIASVKWTDFLNNDKTFAVTANSSHSKISHSKYAALIVKDAIVDQFREKTGERPNIDTKSPDVLINLYIHNNKGTLSIDISGDSLHKRGYRKLSTDAPMQETLAAAIIRLSGWNGETPLYDPMCGSGTLLCEALMHYCKIPSAYYKNHFGFMNLPDFDEQAWTTVIKKAEGNIRDLPENLIIGSDVLPDAIKAAGRNISTFDDGNNIKLSIKDFQSIKNLENYTIITNPPYGIRMGKEHELKNLYQQFGDFLKQKCKNSNAYVYCGNRELIKSVGLKTTFKKPLKNGDLDGRLVKYEVY